MSVTACLITYHRSGNLGRIIDTLERLPFISEILIRDNGKAPPRDQYQGTSTHPVGCDCGLCDGRGGEIGFVSDVKLRQGWNTINYGRYQLAARASNDLIYTQDDDCLIDNIKALHAAFLERRACGADRELVFGLAPTHYPLWAGGTFLFGQARMAIAGWGMLFDRGWLTVPAPARHPYFIQTMSVFQPYWDRHGRDATFYRETDRIFSLLLNRPHAFVEAQVRHLPGSDSGLSASWGEHIASRDLAIQRCLAIIREEERVNA